MPKCKHHHHLDFPSLVLAQKVIFHPQHKTTQHTHASNYSNNARPRPVRRSSRHHHIIIIINSNTHIAPTHACFFGNHGVTLCHGMSGGANARNPPVRLLDERRVYVLQSTYATHNFPEQQWNTPRVRSRALSLSMCIWVRWCVCARFILLPGRNGTVRTVLCACCAPLFRTLFITIIVWQLEGGARRA